MRFGRSRWQRTAGLLVLLCCVVHVSSTRAEPVTSEEAVKAGFLFNFVKFTQWPHARDTEAGPLQVCTPGPQPLDGQFALLQGRLIGNRTLETRSRVASSEWRHCHVLFLTESDAPRLDSIVRDLRGEAVLTVGDLPGFVQAGGMIGLRTEDNRVRFDINLGSAQRAGLTLNSQMIKLAGLVLR